MFIEVKLKEHGTKKYHYATGIRNPRKCYYIAVLQGEIKQFET